MNWNDISFDWNHARSFLATVEEGSLSGAARVLAQTQPTLSRQVVALEEELGLALFERVGRNLVVTPSGRELATHVRAMRDAANAMSLAASGQSQSIEGRVRITASDMMSAYILPTALLHLRRIAPLLQVDVVAANDIRDLQRREADIAIRHVRPTQPDLIARLICDQTGSFYASPAYLERMGTPSDVLELGHHELINFGDPEQMVEYLAPAGIPVTVDNFRIGSQSGVVAWEIAKAGLGIIVMADQIADKFPQMEKLFPNREPFSYPVWLTTHRELNTSRRFRLVFDELAKFLRPQSD